MLSHVSSVCFAMYTSRRDAAHDTKPVSIHSIIFTMADLRRVSWYLCSSQFW